jgi:Zn-dependent protease
MDIQQIIQTVLVYALPVLLAITVHEAAHAYVAKALGDNTAWALGRVTLNPVKHIDPVGTIAMPLLLYFATSGAFVFGYAKPVPVQFGRLNNPKRDMIWVAFAGPAVNFVMAFLWAVFGLLLFAFGVNEPFFVKIAQAGVLVNLVMFAFNLFPLPPLDGGRVLVGMLPWKAAHAVSRIEPYGFFIVLALVVTGIVGSLWMRPVMGMADSLLDMLLLPLQAMLK